MKLFERDGNFADFQSWAKLFRYLDNAKSLTVKLLLVVLVAAGLEFMSLILLVVFLSVIDGAGSVGANQYLFILQSFEKLADSLHPLRAEFLILISLTHLCRTL